MGRMCATILAGLFFYSQVEAQEQSAFADQEKTAYVIEIGTVSYDRYLPPSVIRAFRKDLEENGEHEAMRHGDIVGLAYKQKAVETGRVALKFILCVGDQSAQQITMPDSSIFAQVRLQSANADSLTASITTRFSGKIVSGGGSGGEYSNGSEIPLDDRVHYSGSGGSFALFPNGGGRGYAEQRYVRARVAKPEDLEQPQLNRDGQLPPKVLAKLQANPPRFLALDERWACLRLVTPAEYDDYSTLEKLAELLRGKMEQEVARVVRICELDDDQAEKLGAALLKHRSDVQKEAYALEEVALRNPRLTNDEAQEFRTRLAGLNELLHQSYLTEGSLTAAILQTHLDNEQLLELERATLNEFVSTLAGSELNWDEEQTQSIRSYLEGLTVEKREPVLDHQLLLDALTEEYLTKVLNSQQLKRFLFLRRSSDKAHYFLLNALQ